MKRAVGTARELTLVAVLTVCPFLAAAAPPWTTGPHGDSTRDDDGRHRVVYAIDPITGEPLFTPSPLIAREIVSQALPRSSSPQGSQVDMVHVATVSPSATIISSQNGFDSDHDGRAEFVIRKDVGTLWTTFFETYESVGDDAFWLVDVLHIPPDTDSSYNPGDVGDADGDGLSELIVFGRTNNDFYIRLYESEFTNSYPQELVWEVAGSAADGDSWEVGAKIADTDGDGQQEIVVAGQVANEGRIAVYENDGDNSFELTYFQVFPIHTPQSMEVANDLDGDGRHEIFFGGFEGGAAKIYAVESTGDNTYEQIWSTELIYDDGQPVNVEFIVDAGDLDGDGRKEFLAGGRKTIGSPGPFFGILYVFEAIANNDFQIVASFSLPMGLGYSRANVADVDGDGNQEIVFGTGQVLKVYSNIGDNAWREVWTGSGSERSIGAGDHDGDGKTEIIVKKGGATWIWEIDPADAADMDGDDVVDTIDNCPVTANPDQEDADSDTVGDVCDNCVYGFNPAQGAAIFGQDIQALDSETFSWTEPAEVVYATGDLALVSTYTVDLVQTLPLTTSITDSSAPTADSGFYYLIRPDCPVGSWQTSLGAESERDAALP